MKEFENPLTPDQLLTYENMRASESMPTDLQESMSDRRIHISGTNRNAQVIDVLAEELTSTSSFLLPAGMFIGRLGQDGQTQLSVPQAAEPNDSVVRQPFKPAWQDQIYHPKLAPLSPDMAVKGREAERIRTHRLYEPENRTVFRPEGYPWTCIGRA
ncbi:TPA: hypothetical protein QCY66_005509 [Bacillus cereus]|nr:hypothetical protein [Bacillus cereus]